MTSNQNKTFLGWFLGNSQSLSRRHKRKNPYPARGKPILRLLWISNQNYWPIGGIRHIFSVQLYTGSLSLFILFCKPQYWYVCKFLEEADCQHANDKQSKQLSNQNKTLLGWFLGNTISCGDMKAKIHIQQVESQFYDFYG